MSSNSDKKQPRELKFLERVREQLCYWPYTLHQIDDTLDISLIEGRGRQLLYRGSPFQSDYKTKLEIT